MACPLPDTHFAASTADSDLGFTGKLCSRNTSLAPSHSVSYLLHTVAPSAFGFGADSFVVNRRLMLSLPIAKAKQRLHMSSLAHVVLGLKQSSIC